jgi:nitrile hydratase accessory protein
VSFEDWTGDDAPPRDNGELVFAEPWHARAFALAVTLVEQLGLPWRDFQTRLIAAIAEDPDREYYESWAVALESLVVDHDLATADAITAATPTERAPL